MIIDSPSIVGTGQISGAFQSECRAFLAIASAFPRLTNPPGRAAYSGQALGYRLSLFRRGETAPFATFDQLRLPINHVSFHPVDPVVAIAAGRYDGGWMFEGDLVLWDWAQDDGTWRPFKQTPEVVRCSFAGDGDRLDLLVRPWDEEWGVPDGTHWESAFDRLYPVSISHPVIGDSVPVNI